MEQLNKKGFTGVQKLRMGSHFRDFSKEKCHLTQPGNWTGRLIFSCLKSDVNRCPDGSTVVVRWKYVVGWQPDRSLMSISGPAKLRHQAVFRRYSGRWSRRSEEARAISDLSLTSLPFA
ncbi:hypothetical protein M5K25_005773 [Dendrobium thyrsiflorum]|uniref:Uncharacterized protein n=1 Tax=Dendrobium thyrsiflorum TaxID=117978 RepID=A0ABD0VR75_DENTH